VLTKNQVSAVANALVPYAETKSTARALARFTLRAGKPPPGVSVARFGELVVEAERHVATSWKILVPLGASIIVVLAGLHYKRAPSLMFGFVPCALALLLSLRRKLVQAYIRKVASADA
jgi:hypothetical protein